MEDQQPISKPPRFRWKDAAHSFLLGGLAGVCCEVLNLDVLMLGFNYMVPVMAVLGAAIGLTRGRRILLPLNSALFVAILILRYTPLAAHLPRGQDQYDVLQKADAVVVLASGYINDQTIAASAQDRVLKGLEVLHDGYATKMMVTNPHGEASIFVPQVRNQVQKLGLNADIIEVGPVGNTHDESIAVANICRQRGWKKVILVTQAWHMKRAAALFAKQGLEVIKCPSLESEYDAVNVRGPSDRQAAFRSWLHEQIGLWVYAWRGWI